MSEHAKNTRGVSKYNSQNNRNEKRTGEKTGNQKKKSQTKLPKFMYPNIIYTASNKMAFCEEGGSNTQTGTLKGYSKIICSCKGESKRPIYMFKPRSFDSADNHKKSLVFYAAEGDYIISVACRGITEKIPGLISIAIYSIVKYSKKSDGNKPPISMYKPSLKHSFIFSFPEQSEQGNEMRALYGNKLMGLTNYFTHTLCTVLSDKHLKFLEKPICSAITRANADKTEYSYFRNASGLNKITNGKIIS